METHITEAHVDGDVLVYRSGFAAQHTHYRVFQKGTSEAIQEFPNKKEYDEWLKKQENPEDFFFEKELLVEPVQNALYSAKNTIKRIKSQLNAERVKVWLTDGPSNFRINLATTAKYKGNRVAEKPVHYEALRQYLIDVWNAEVVYGEEADDAMSIAQWAAFRRDEEDSICICTIDKDLDMVPGWHYNFTTDVLYYMPEHEAMHWFYKQLLMGDPTDNIIGLHKVGPKKAEKILETCTNEKEMYWAVRAAYSVEFGEDKCDDRLIENARLLWMRSKTNEFWSPPV
jgi:hypothetical protein